MESITPTELRMHLEFLASDELGGRYTLSPNFAIAARYLAAHLQAYGFRGAANGSFLQSFDVISAKADAAKTTLELTVNGKPVVIKFGEDFLLSASSGAAVAEGQIVFVGAGVSAPELKHDDYAGKDVKGKIVLIVPGTPAGIDASRLKEDQHGPGAAVAHGAVGILQLPQQRFLQFMRDKSVLQRFATRESVSLSRENDGKLPALTLAPDAAEKLLATAGLDLNTAYENAAKMDPPKGQVISASGKISVALQQTRTTTQNVAGILEGTDPQLKNEYVVFSA
ncbi:MAG TPA: hypothetical protein VFL42_10015, partial [Terriglobales bacterium]|nr:hypothetical protein [Terriglobales bacterium]